MVVGEPLNLMEVKMGFLILEVAGVVDKVFQPTAALETAAPASSSYD